MEYPKLKNPPVSRQILQTFGGYDRSTRIDDGAFRDMKNLTSDHFPAMSPRSLRGRYRTSRIPTGLAWRNGLWYMEADAPNQEEAYWGHFKVDDTEIHKLMLSDYRSRQVVCMGAYYIVMPLGFWANTACYDPATGIFSGKDSVGMISHQSQKKNVRLLPCRIDGTAYGEEELPTDSQEATTAYVRLEGEGIHMGFSQYDGVKISELTGELAHLNGDNILWQVGKDFVVIQGMLTAPKQAEELWMERSMPEMDFVIECGNRLWGCRYGKNAAGEFVNEIYCSRLGDFKNWQSFLGVATDSAVISLGSDGPFTGAISYMGHPIFFKENVLHKVYISATGAHSVTDTPCSGVQSGCAKSLAVVGDTLFYKSRSGIMAYDGSLPVRLPDVFGGQRYDTAVGGACQDKYYISMGRDNRYDLFVYDTRRQLWHREDGLQVREFVTDGDRLYAAVGDDILILAGADEPEETEVSWFAETGPMELTTPDRKYLTRLNARIALEPGTEVSFYVRYDFSPRWEHLHTVVGKELGCLDIPLRPKRCDHMYLRLEGKGPALLYSLTKTVEQGSERI